MIRPLLCPICGASVLVEVTTDNFPEVHRIPEHVPLLPVNLCMGQVITVTIDYDNCSKCGKKMSKNRSGLCIDCYGEEEKLLRQRWQEGTK